MRTPIDLPDSLAEELRAHAAAHDRTLRDLVVDGVRRVPAWPTEPFRLRSAAFPGPVGFQPGLGPDDALADVRDDPAEGGPTAR
ncbi:MAG: hypothetical protein ABMA64_10755 [Myxococcota bacterium]